MTPPKVKHIEVVPYSPEWPRVFEAEAAKIKKALGETCLDIHHIGSTSVPCLAAKPVIDIIAVLQKPAQAIGSLESLGYRYKGEYNIPGRFYFNKKGVNLHVYEETHPEIELNLTFRNFLRNHPETRDAYSALKADLLTQKSSFEVKNSSFSGYNLGKDAFIRQVLKQAGFQRLRILKCTHHAEWGAAKALRQREFFDKHDLQDPYTWTFEHPNHVHLVLYKGVEIIGYAHLQRWPEGRVALRIIVIERPHRSKGFGRKFLEMIEKWLLTQDCKLLQTEASPSALPFYQKCGYAEMPFDDPDGYEGDPQDTALGKRL